MPTTPVASPYALCSLAEVREYLGYESGDTKRDNTIQRGINSASIAIARRAQRQFVVPAAFQSLTKPRWTRITPEDVKRGYVRVGDMWDVPATVSFYSPGRNDSGDPMALSAIDGDYWLLPDIPEPGMPFEYVNFIEAGSWPLVANQWLKVTSVKWGFETVPEDIIACTVACAAAYVTNDPNKQSELAAQTGRRVKIESILLPEWEDIVDEYRIFRIS